MSEQIVVKITKENVKQIINGGMFATKSSTLPIIENIKCTIKDDCMEIVSTDLQNEICIKTKLEESVSTPCEFCVSFDEFKNALKSIDDEFITLYISLDEHYVGIKHAKGKMKFPINNTDNYPKNEIEDVRTTFALNSDTFIHMTSIALNFVCTDQLRAQMCGVNLVSRVNENGCKLMYINATDAQRLYQDYIGLGEQDDEQFDIIISPESIKALRQFGNRPYENIELQISNSKIKFVISDEIYISSRLIDGKYPNVDAVIPKNLSIESSLNIDDLSSSIRRLMNCCNKNTYQAKFQFSKDKGLLISSEDIEFAKKASEQIECESSEDITIGLNLNYLQNILGIMCETKKVNLQMNNPRKAIIIKSDNTNLCNQICLLMPMLLTD